MRNKGERNQNRNRPEINLSNLINEMKIEMSMRQYIPLETKI
jgi:hypothetical protein